MTLVDGQFRFGLVWKYFAAADTNIDKLIENILSEMLVTQY